MENIERRSVHCVGKYIFENEEDARDYLKSCEVDSEVIMPFYTDDIERYQDLDELGITDEELEAWEDRNYELAKKYKIFVDRIRFSYEGSKYRLSGTYKNLLRFSKEYASHPTLDDIGEYSYEIMDGIIEFDYDRGDDSFAIGELY